jgi:mycothiol system anti-sigma-R factor
MECHRVREAMYWVSDNELDAELLPPFRDHLPLCPHCAHYYAYVSKLLALVRGCSCRYSAPSTLRIRILASLPPRGGVIRERVE